MSISHGTIAFDTLTTSDQVKTGTEKSVDTSYVFNGVAKMWIQLNGNTEAVADSFNAGSVTDTADGQKTVAITNDMANTNYSTMCQTNNSHSVVPGSGIATGSIRLDGKNDSHTHANNGTFMGLIHGDLA